MRVVLLILRHLLAVMLLPGIVAGVVPAWIRSAQRAGDSRWLHDSWQWWLGRIGGVVAVAAGLTLAVWCVTLFARVGQGTLAPWDPTQRLVVVGPYRYLRNPMITGVAMLLAGQAIWAGSWKLAVWLAVFVAANHVYFVAVEEPGLVARFGPAYREYTARVPRWIPRRTPWSN